MLCLKMPARDYEAIVVGASFGGLAVARQLRGEVLLLDRNEVGTVQTSACGTPLWVPETLGVSDSVLQVHDRLLIRTPTRTVRYDLSSVPFCTFDYRAFCQGLLAQCRVRFLRTSVSGIQDGAVVTGEGRFTAPVIVDCSGWRRAITGGAETEPRSPHRRPGLRGRRRGGPVPAADRGGHPARALLRRRVRPHRAAGPRRRAPARGGARALPPAGRPLPPSVPRAPVRAGDGRPHSDSLVRDGHPGRR